MLGGTIANLRINILIKASQTAIIYVESRGLVIYLVLLEKVYHEGRVYCSAFFILKN